ncbi:MAG: lytic transglycosylase domain-containing protein [Paracoccaceae bacterium]
MPRPTLLAALALASMLLPAPAAAAAPPTGATPALCRDAARAAAARHGVPAGIMRAITLVETRRKVDGRVGPWPWTLNVDGRGYWHDTRAEALAHAEREIAGGRRSIDLGCFQLNYRWHGGNFEALDDMLEPALAAEYAARFLGQLYAETGDWMRAAGLYHSRTPVHARRYRGLVGRALASLDSIPDSPAAPEAAPEPGPRPPEPVPVEPAHSVVLASAPAGGDPVPAPTPGAVMLRMFTSPVRPLIAAGPKI